MFWLILAAILILALALRWTGIDWDDYNHYHPDERYITWVATSIEWPSSWSDVLDPVNTSFNPFYWPADGTSEGVEVLQGEPRKFAYGHFPLYLGVMATRVAEYIGPVLQKVLADDWLLSRDIFNARGAIEFRHLTAVSRALTGLVDTLLIFVIFLTGRRMYGVEVGLLAAAFLALNVMHIQLSHFFTSDPYMALFVALALFFMIRGVGSSDELTKSEKQAGTAKGLRRYLHCRSMRCNILLAAAFIGLAVGSKFAAIMLFLPLATALWLGGASRRWTLIGASLFTTFLVFFTTNPFAVLDLGCEVISPVIHLGPISIPALDWRSCYLQNIVNQGAMVRGGVDLGFTRQYSGTLPYLYPIEMQIRWGMGLLLGMTAFTGFAWSIWQGIQYLAQRMNAKLTSNGESNSAKGDASLVLLAWTLPFFLTTGGFYVKFMRYLLPLTPFLMLYAAALLWQLRSRVGRGLIVGLVFAATAVYAFSFVNIYKIDHPWDIASRWIYANVEPQTLIASEQWDDSLPTTMLVDGKMRRRSEYENEQLTWLTGPDEHDNNQKLARNLDLLQRAEYVTIVSNRVYDVVPRLPLRYPLSSQVHQLLFDGDLGYRPVFVTTRTPNILGLHLKPNAFSWPNLLPPSLVESYLAGLPGLDGGRFDESFTVYDQPLVTIFKNVERKTAEEMQQYFNME